MYQTKPIVRRGPGLSLYQSVWLLTETVSFTALTICPGAVITAPEGKYVTLTVNGVGKQIKPGTYTGDVVLSLSEGYLLAPQGLMRFNRISRYLHAAIVVDGGKHRPEMGVPQVVWGGRVTDRSAEDIYIASDEKSFNGILVAGDSEYTISKARLDLDGDSDNDFLGVGAAVAATGDAVVTINDSEFNLSGVTRCALHVGGNSTVTLNNCKLTNHSPDSDWPGSFSWQVGFAGTNRLAQLADNGTVYYNNCHCKTNGWGVLSIDGSDEGVRMIVKDSKLELTGPRAHGYGAFCIGDNEIVFDHTEADVNGYPMLVMGMEGKGRPSIINGSVIRGRRFGAMVVGDDNSVFTISDSAFDTGRSSLVIKGSATLVNITNTSFKAGNGVILQLMDSDEAGMNAADYKIPVGLADTRLPDRDLAAVSETEDVTVNLKDCAIMGDFLNSTTNLRYHTHCLRGGMGVFHDAVIGPMPEMAPPPETDAPPKDDRRGPKNLGLNLDNTTIAGVISAATQKYRDGLTVITENSRLELSNVTQTPARPVNNGVAVSLANGSVWTVTGDAYITALSISPDSAVAAEAGKRLAATVDGVGTALVPGGAYQGEIAIRVS